MARRSRSLVRAGRRLRRMRSGALLLLATLAAAVVPFAAAARAEEEPWRPEVPRPLPVGTDCYGVYEPDGRKAGFAAVAVLAGEDGGAVRATLEIDAMPTMGGRARILRTRSR